VAANKHPLLIEADAQNTLSDEFINDIEGLEEPALDAQPHAGGLLAVAVDVAGCPVHAFGG